MGIWERYVKRLWEQCIGLWEDEKEEHVGIWRIWKGGVWEAKREGYGKMKGRGMGMGRCKD